MSNTSPVYKILCLEDNLKDIKAQIDDVSKALAAKVYWAKNFAEATELLSFRTYDLFLLDIEVKGEGAVGLQFANNIRLNPQNSKSPIIFISVYKHFSNRALSYFRNSSFLSKPFSSEKLVEICGLSLDIPMYTNEFYRSTIFSFDTKAGMHVEISPDLIKYIEYCGNRINIKYTDDRCETYQCPSGTFKRLLSKVRSDDCCPLKQVYRTIILNENQIKKITIQKKTGEIWLFDEKKPIPLGISYRINLSDFKGEDNERI